MRIDRILEEKRQGVAFEFFPPKKEASQKPLELTVQTLKSYRPLYVSMTCGAGGGVQGRTQEAVQMLLSQKDLEVMPHLTGVAIDRDHMKTLLDGYKANGIENLMVLRGDPPKGVADFDFSKQEFPYAEHLVAFIRKDYENFCIGVAVYPEGHVETDTLERDLENTKRKIDAGADFAVTQMFFKNAYYYEMLDRMKKKGITIPVRPGILPLTDVAKVKQFASICRATIPEEIDSAMERFRDNPEEMEKVGLEFTIRQCRELIQNGFKQIHFFTLNRRRGMQTVLDAIWS